MQIEVSASGRRVTDPAETGGVVVDLYDSVIAAAGEVEGVGFETGDLMIASVRVLTSSFGTVYGVRVVFEPKPPRVAARGVSGTEARLIAAERARNRAALDALPSPRV